MSGPLGVAFTALVRRELSDSISVGYADLPVEILSPWASRLVEAEPPGMAPKESCRLFAIRDI